MAIPLVDLGIQYESLRPEINASIQKVLDARCFILGPPVDEFESAFARFCGASDCVGVASGTDALQLMLPAWGSGRATR